MAVEHVRSAEPAPQIAAVDLARYRELRRRGHTITRSYRIGAADAEDVVQEAFVRMMRVPADGTGSPRRYEAYFDSTVRHLCIDHMRSRGRETELPAPEDLPQTRSERTEQRILVREVLAAMPPSARSVLVKNHLEGRSVTEISQDLGISANACSAMLYRARRAFRERYLSSHLLPTRNDDCAAVRALMVAAALEPGGEVAAEVAAHRRECEDCESQYAFLLSARSAAASALLPGALAAMTAGGGLLALLAPAKGGAGAGSAGSAGAGAGGVAASTVAIAAGTVLVVAAVSAVAISGLRPDSAPTTAVPPSPVSTSAPPAGDDAAAPATAGETAEPAAAHASETAVPPPATAPPSAAPTPPPTRAVSPAPAGALTAPVSPPAPVTPAPVTPAPVTPAPVQPAPVEPEPEPEPVEPPTVAPGSALTADQLVLVTTPTAGDPAEITIVGGTEGLTAPVLTLTLADPTPGTTPALAPHAVAPPGGDTALQVSATTGTCTATGAAVTCALAPIDPEASATVQAVIPGSAAGSSLVLTLSDGQRTPVTTSTVVQAPSPSAALLLTSPTTEARTGEWVTIAVDQDYTVPQYETGPDLAEVMVEISAPIAGRLELGPGPGHCTLTDQGGAQCALGDQHKHDVPVPITIRVVDNTAPATIRLTASANNAAPVWTEVTFGALPTVTLAGAENGTVHFTAGPTVLAGAVTGPAAPGTPVRVEILHASDLSPCRNFTGLPVTTLSAAGTFEVPLVVHSWSGPEPDLLVRVTLEGYTGSAGWTAQIAASRS